MKHKRQNKTALFFILAMFPFVVYGKPEASLKQCQKWKDKIEHYSELRRKGGSAKKMEGWRTKRREIKEKFRAHDCDQWRRKLK